MRYLLFLTLTALMLASFTAFADQRQDIQDILNEVSAYADKNPSVLDGAVFSVGDAYVRENKIDEAIALYEKAMNIIPDNENLLNRIGNLYNQKMEYGKAAGIYEKLIKIRPDNTWYFQVLTNAYNMTSQKDKAVGVWKRLIAEKPNDPNILMEAAGFYSNVNDMDSGIPLAEKAVQLDPNNIGYVQTLATFYSRAEKFDKAEEAYKKVLATAKDQWLKDWANGELLNIYQKENRLGEMAAQYEDELKSEARDVSQYKQLGELYIRTGETDKALDMFKKAIELSPDDRSINNRLVDLYDSTGKYEDAAAQLAKIIQTAPKEPYLLERLGNLYDRAGNKNEAKKAWQSLAGKVTSDPALYSRYAEALYRWGDLKEAIAQFQKAESIDPGNLAYTLRRGAILIDARSLEEAKVALGRVAVEAREDWMKNEAKRYLDEVVKIQSAPKLEERPKKPTPEVVFEEFTSSEAKEGEDKVKEKPDKKPEKKRRGFFGFGR